MAFKVFVTEPAEQDINEAFTYISRDDFIAASKWYAELWKLIFSLKEMPSRFNIVQEADELGLQYRSVNHYSHRIIYRIDDATMSIFVVRVYHGSRKPLSHEDVN
jgi:plasmid stabilization system protein ParE